MQLDYFTNGYHAPFYVALEKGWYRDAGLDVTLRPGKGTADVIRTMTAGAADFGFPDFASLPRLISDGAPVIAVASVVSECPIMMISLEGKPVRAPNDLLGKTVGVVPGTSTSLMLAALFKINNIDESKLNKVTYGFGAMVPSLLTQKVDAIPGYIFGEYLAAKNSRKDVVAFKMSDFGVHSYANGIAVRSDFMKKNPDAVRAFVKTTMRALEYSLANRQEAISILAKFTETPAATLAEQLDAAASFIDTENARKVGYGVMTKDVWTATQNIQVKYGEQNAILDDEKLWTNRFVQ